MRGLLGERAVLLAVDLAGGCQQQAPGARGGEGVDEVPVDGDVVLEPADLEALGHGLVGGQVHDGVKAVEVGRGQVADITDLKACGTLTRRGDRQVVDCGDGTPGSAQRAGEGGADEASGSGDQQFHSRVPLEWGGSGRIRGS